jgi:hypothetical protein
VVPNGVELQKTTQNEPSPPKSEGRFQARQLKEAGASTLSQSVVINDVNSRSPKVSPQDQDEDFKPANETQDGGDITGECYKKSFKGGLTTQDSRSEDKKSKRNRAKKKASLEKGKSSQSRKTYAESSSEEPPVSIRRISKDKAEQICLMWIKSLNEIQAKINMENSKAHSDKDMPVYCSNRICPISKDKIQKTPRVLKQLQKVRMNKVHIENEYMEDDRWYCHKCLEAHQHSLYCQYCSQIYFLEEEGLEDEGKTWICCDK